MSIKYFPTNCPNCGSPLDSGSCSYCGTKIKLLNTLEINNFGFGNIMDINLQIRNGDGTIHILPLRGSISNIELQSNSCDVVDLNGSVHRIRSNNTEVEFTFNGIIREE